MLNRTAMKLRMEIKESELKSLEADQELLETIKMVSDQQNLLSESLNNLAEILAIHTKAIKELDANKQYVQE